MPCSSIDRSGFWAWRIIKSYLLSYCNYVPKRNQQATEYFQYVETRNSVGNSKKILIKFGENCPLFVVSFLLLRSSDANFKLKQLHSSLKQINADLYCFYSNKNTVKCHRQGTERKYSF